MQAKLQITELVGIVLIFQVTKKTQKNLLMISNTTRGWIVVPEQYLWISFFMTVIST